MRKNTVLETIQAHLDEMFSAESKVADYVLNHPEKAVMLGVSELANLSGVSDATVIRMCKRSGFQGYHQMRILLSHDLGRSMLMQHKQGAAPDTVRGLLEMMSGSLLTVADNLNTTTLLDCAALIRDSDMVHLAAAGNSALVASDLGFRLGRLGVRTTFSQIPEYFLNSVSLAGQGDILIAISRSGSSRQAIHALELARQKGMKCIVITGYEMSPMSRMADHLLLTRGGAGLFDDSQPESHLVENAVVDLLLYFVLNGEAIGKNLANPDTVKALDDVEVMLSEYKL